MSFLSSRMLPTSSVHGLCASDGFSSPRLSTCCPRGCVGCRLRSDCFRMASYVCALEHLAFLGTVKYPLSYPWSKNFARCLMAFSINVTVAVFRPNNSVHSYFLVLLLCLSHWTQSDRHCNIVGFFDCHSLSRIFSLFSHPIFCPLVGWHDPCCTQMPHAFHWKSRTRFVLFLSTGIFHETATALWCIVPHPKIEWFFDRLEYTLQR
jgi:hypothetical protein